MNLNIRCKGENIRFSGETKFPVISQRFISGLINPELYILTSSLYLRNLAWLNAFKNITCVSFFHNLHLTRRSDADVRECVCVCVWV